MLIKFSISDNDVGDMEISEKQHIINRSGNFNVKLFQTVWIPQDSRFSRKSGKGKTVNVL